MRFQRQWAMSHPAGPWHAFAQSTMPVSRPLDQSTLPGWKSRCTSVGVKGGRSPCHRSIAASHRSGRWAPAGGRVDAGSYQRKYVWPGGPPPTAWIRAAPSARRSRSGTAIARPGRKLMSSAGTPSPTVRPVTSAATTSGTGSPWSCREDQRVDLPRRRFRLVLQEARPHVAAQHHAAAVREPQPVDRGRRGTREAAHPLDPCARGRADPRSNGVRDRRAPQLGREARQGTLVRMAVGRARGHPASATCLGR